MVCIVIVATWNVNSLKARLPRVTEWLEQTQPDVVCLQETKMADTAFPALDFKELGYESVHRGEGRWNGVAILSKVGLESPVYELPNEPEPQARFVGALCGGVWIHSVYVPNGRAVDDPHYIYKQAWMSELVSYLEQKQSSEEDVVVAGDWNIAPQDIDVWDRSFFDGMTHVTPQERQCLADVKNWGLVDVMREEFPDKPGVYSYYDYQAGRFHKRQGMRIDYVLATKSLAARCKLNLVDRNARKGTKPSDHAPVIAVFS